MSPPSEKRAVPARKDAAMFEWAGVGFGKQEQGAQTRHKLSQFGL